MIKKLLIANRGEIAVRAIRCCNEMDIETVAVYSRADHDSMHVKIADSAICIGNTPAYESYANKKAILSAAIVTNCDAIFPGYGFLSENHDFAEMVEQHGFIFVGPSYNHIKQMGDKITAKRVAKELGLPLVPGSNGEVKTLLEAEEIAKDFGYPIVIKAAGGGGGKGIRIVTESKELKEAFNLCKKEAQFFASSALYIEKYIVNPRHIEVQIIGDQQGKVLHLYERECSIQRNHQKVLEEAPSAALSQEERNYICSLTAEAMQKLGYYSAGTVEYLYSNGNFYFMEMNTRIQVEHTVTEEITGVDILFEMINIANGKPLSYNQEDIRISGHAIECRVLAENPRTFIPSPGKITNYYPPSGLGVRVDSAIYSGYTVSPHYDSMIAKLIIYGKNRKHCIKRTRRALEEFIIDGIETSIPLHIQLMNSPDFQSANFDIKWLETKFLR